MSAKSTDEETDLVRPYEDFDCDALQEEIASLQADLHASPAPSGPEKARLVSAIKEAQAERKRKGC